MRSSYTKDDVILLLKDITGLVEPQPTEERENLYSPANIIAKCCLLNMFPVKNIWRFTEKH